MEREWIPNIEIDRDTTLSALKKILKDKKVRWNKGEKEAMENAVAQAEDEMRKNNSLSQETASQLDSLLSKYNNSHKHGTK